MGLQQLHDSISPQQNFRRVAKTQWKDPNARSLRGCVDYPDRRLHRYDCQLLQLSVQFLVLEAARSPPPPTPDLGRHLQCRWQPGCQL